VQTKIQLESRTKIEFVKQFVEHIFPAQSTQNWATAAASELEKGSRMEDLRIRKEGLEWNPYYSATDVKSWEAARLPSSNVDFAGARYWLNMPRILVGDVTQANAQALEHLQNGADGIVFDLPSGFTETAKLLEGIQMPYCAIHFFVSDQPDYFLTSFHAFVDQKFPEENINANLYWKGEPDLSQVVKLRKRTSFRGAGVVVANKETAADQLAAALQDAVERVESLKKLGLSAEEATSHISFSLQLGNDFFLEAVKLRVLRALWNAILVAYQVKSSKPLFIHALSNPQVNGVFQPHGNLIKETYAAMAAILGGCDGLTTEPEDYNNPTMVRMARNTSSVLREESFFSLVADPLGGSYLVEQLTKNLAEETWAKFQLLTKA
jgi:methylmalonyl-CoA mutase